MSELSVVLSNGTVFGGDFLVEGALGSGGMGAVHRVRQLSTEKARALKVMRPELVADIDFRRCFIQEARVGSRIESDHVIEVHAAGVDEPSRLPSFLVMELRDGGDLRVHMTDRGALPLAEVRDILQQVYHAVSAAHAVGIVHRDIKPENIFLGRSRRSGIALNIKLLDFGIAKIVADAVTATTAALGSPLWMAPEQTGRGPITPGADVWALGLLAFSMLTGRYFWREASLGEMSFARLVRELLVDQIPTATERASELGCGHFVPPGFDAWFARSVVRDVTERFSDASMQWVSLWPLLAAPAHGVRHSVALGTCRREMWRRSWRCL